MNETNNLHYLNFPTLEEVEKVAESCKTLQIAPISEVSFFYIDKDTIANRILLRKLLNTNENDHFVLVSTNKEVSFLAWKAAVFAFLHYKKKGIEMGLLDVKNRLQKYPFNNTKVQEKLKINFKGGFDLVAINEICFCTGSGNYTYIYLQNGTRKCISYPLSVLEKRLQEISFLKRIGKSFIVNINRIKKVQSQYIVFKGTTELELKLGDIYIKRVKQNLLWY
jgi:DNA-binding LytR/AlgR family response regulator